MAILLKVSRVDLSEQPDSYHIKNIGGNSNELEWKHTRAQAIKSIEEDAFCYYIEKDARVLKLKVGLSPNGNKFLKTEADGDKPQLLLSLTKNFQSQSGQRLRF
jgi:hypothetical protein